MKRVLGAVLVAMAALTSSAQAQTTPQYDYDGAIRERVYIPNGLDADRDGIEDRSAIEIMRPKELGHGCAGDHRAEPVLHERLRPVRR